MASGKAYEHFGMKPPKEIIQQEYENVTKGK
jgi:hypothetical protein